MNPFKDKAFLIILLVAILLRVNMMWSFDIDHDEWYTLDVASRDFIDMHKYIIDDVHVPLYLYISKAFFMIFGVSEFSLRLPAVIFGILGIIVFFVFMTRFFGKKIAYLGTGLLAISGFHIAHSLNARMYSLLFLLTISAMYFLYSLMEKWNNKDLFYIIIINILLFYTHLFAVFFFIFQLILLFRKNIFETLKFCFFVAIGSIPVGIFYLYQVYKKIIGDSYGDWMYPTSIDEIYWVFSAISSSYVLTPAFILLFLLFIVLNYKKILSFSKEMFLVLQIVICVTIPLLITFFIEPIFALRYFMVAYPAFFIIIILTLWDIKKRSLWLFLVLIALIIFFTLYAIMLFHTEKVRVHEEAIACYNQMNEELHWPENVTLVVQRWLNDWYPTHRPTNKAYDYFTNRFDHEFIFVNEHHTTLNITTERVILFGPTLFHPYVDASNWTFFRETVCRGLWYKEFIANPRIQNSTI